jgi:hypothetical protein
MKRTAVLGITAFYLLLTTGMFVCIIHCAVDKLKGKPAMHMTSKAGNCKHDDNCDCCKKHANFVIKENLKPDAKLHLAQIFTLILPVKTVFFYPSGYSDQHHPVTCYGKAPPGWSGKHLSILFRSLMI